MLIQLGPCEVKMSMVHVLIVTLQSTTTVLVAWLTMRAQRKDRVEKAEKLNGGNGK